MKPRIFCGILPLSSSDPFPRRCAIPPSFPGDHPSPQPLLRIDSFLWKSVPATIFLLLELSPTPFPLYQVRPPGKPKNTGAGSLSLLQQIFPTQESNQGLLHCRRILYQLSYQGSPQSACNVGDLGSISGVGRSPGQQIGYPLQYSWASLVA